MWQAALLFEYYWFILLRIQIIKNEETYEKAEISAWHVCLLHVNEHFPFCKNLCFNKNAE